MVFGHLESQLMAYLYGSDYATVSLGSRIYFFYEKSQNMKIRMIIAVTVSCIRPCDVL